MKNLWLWWNSEDVEIEKLQAVQEGRDISSVEQEFNLLSKEGIEHTLDLQQKMNNLLDTVQTLPIRDDYTFEEPSDLQAIRDTRPQTKDRISAKKYTDNVTADKIHGAWLGRCAGCLLGKPVEGWRTDQLWPIVKAAGHEMLTDYFWRLGITKDILAELKPDAQMFTEFDHMPRDDDADYTITGMALVKSKGIQFTSNDVAQFWMTQIPLLSTCTAERVAYRNFANQISPPLSAVVRNPYREWIGAQIRADFYGYVALGRPELAAELAWRDASISHVKNGIYGEMWVAAALAAAGVENDICRIIEIGLNEIPFNSRFSEKVRSVLAWHDEGITYQDAVKRIHQQWDEYHSHDWCHVISNAQIVTMALLWSEGDFEQAITKSVWPGFDTDCNGATVGSIMGMVLGADALPDKWTSPLNDTLLTSVSGYNRTTISGTAKIMFDLYKQEFKA